MLSEPTTQQTVEQAGLHSESEHCQALKILDAHLFQLAGRVDVVFVPRILSTLQGHLACPKLGAIPDAARAGVLAGQAILTLDIDERKVPLQKTLQKLAKSLGVGRTQRLPAAQAALRAMQAAREDNRTNTSGAGTTGSFLLLGHPYLLYDDFFSGHIIRKLRALSAKVECADFGLSTIEPGFIKWDTCAKMYAQLLTLNQNNCDGVIQISAFNCGCDSIMMVFFQEHLQKAGIPYMNLVIDDHASRGWIDTRLEAFIESIRWQHASSSHSHDG